jgi:glycosyltransferase involved in cell wall biosynthesis
MRRPESRNIAFFAPSAYPLGGVADWLDYALDGLSKNGWTCRLHLVTGSGHDVDRYISRHPWELTHSVSNISGSREGRVRGFLAAIDRFRPDLVVSVNLVDVYEAVRRMHARSPSHSPRVLMALHGLESSLIEDIRRERDVLDAVIATNRLSVELARKALSDSERVYYAPYGVPLQPVDRLHVDLCSLRLLWAGRIEQDQKRVLDLPAILKGLLAAGIDAHLSIAGGGPLEPALREIFSTRDLASRVDWLGELDATRLAQAYRSHDALLITSVWETGPIVAWEAMSHGLPVVSSRYIGSGLEGSLIHGVNAMLFDVGDISGAVSAVALLRNSDRRRALAAGGLALLSQCYSREASVSAWHQALTAVMAAPRVFPGNPRLSPPSGRLDRWIGVERAEDLRRWLGVRFIPDSPGSAWPHTGSTSVDEAAFLEHARGIDLGEEL